MEELQVLTGPDEYISSLETPVVRVLGPDCSFSDDLARTLFDTNNGSRFSSRRPMIVQHRSLFEVAQAIRHNSSAIGVFPVENSTTSAVQAVTDELLTGDFMVVGEATLLINLILAGPPDMDIEIDEIETVLSHPKPFGQARRFLESHNFRNLGTMDSTSQAAQIVAEAEDPKVAALCSIRAARRFGLQHIAEGVQDRSDNRTRFLLVKSMEGNTVPDIEIASRGVRPKLSALK